MYEWLNKEEVEDALVLDKKVDIDTVDLVVQRGYELDPATEDLNKMGMDPFLIGYALASGDRTVVTKESRKPSARGSNRRIPDVCEALEIPCHDDFEMYRVLNFTTRSN